MLILILIFLVLFFGGGGWYLGNHDARGYGPHFGIGAIVLILLIFWLLGGFTGFHLH